MQCKKDIHRRQASTFCYFSAEGNIDYKPASINGETIDVEEVSSGLSQLGDAIKEASGKRDKSKQK